MKPLGPIRMCPLAFPAAIFLAMASARLMGIANPIDVPAPPSDWLFAAVFMPITCPAALASAPPESPSAIGALVCSMLCRVSVFWPLPESLAVMVRPSAVIVPLLTVGGPPRPPALPMATTAVPRVTLDASPTCTGFSPEAPCSLISATSSAGSTPSTVAWYFLPPFTVVAVRCVDPATTWLLVSTTPLEDRIMPVPAAAPSWYLSVELMSTTPGWTLFATDCTSMLAVFALPALRFGEGICCEETEFGDWELWFSATTAPAPAPAASAATTT